MHDKEKENHLEHSELTRAWVSGASLQKRPADSYETDRLAS